MTKLAGSPAAGPAGRPQTPRPRRPRNPEKTRNAILQAATEEFAAKGLGGARVDEIASRSGANKRMIYHYFGGKDTLFRAVMENIYETICRAEESLDLDRHPPAKAIERLIDFVWNYYLENPQSITLLNSENLHGARHLTGSAKARGMHPPFEAMIERVLRRGVADGVFRPGIEPSALYLTIAGLAYFYLSNNATLSVFFDRDLRSRRALSAWRSHIRQVVLRFLAA